MRLIYRNSKVITASQSYLSLNTSLLCEKVNLNLHIPINQFLKLKCSFILECSFTGAPNIFVTWYKDGKQLYTSYRYKIKVTPDSCILEYLHSSNVETSGKCSCEISNAYGSDIRHAQIKTRKQYMTQEDGCLHFF